MRTRSGTGDAGMALVVVVWILGAIAALGAVASRLAVAQQKESDLALQRVHADLATRAALDVAAAAILDDGALQGRGEASQSFGEFSVTARYENETARIDINKAAEPLLEGLFVSVGVSRAEAGRLAAAVADWRDEDDETRPSGAERLAYGPDRTPPRNGPFIDPAEIRYVLGVTPKIAAAVQPMITVLSGSDRIDARLASPAVMRALPGVTPLRLKAYADGLVRGMPESDALALLGDVSAYVGPEAAPGWRVEIEISGRDGPLARYLATLLMSSGEERPYDVLAFSEAGPGAGG